MAKKPKNRPSTILSGTRTNKDWIMIAVGILLTALFVISGYFALYERDIVTTPKARGPVKSPPVASWALPSGAHRA